jgi:hypothetical protein
VAQSPRHLLSRMLHFRLRTFLIAVAVLAAVCGLSYRKLHERAVVEQLADLRCAILYDYELDAEGRMKMPEDRIPPGPAWLRKLLGDDFWATPRTAWFQCLDNSADENEQTLKLLPQLPTIREVWLDGFFDHALERLQQALPNATIEEVESG